MRCIIFLLVLVVLVMIVLWFISDNFKLALLTRYVLRNLKSMLKDGFINAKVAEIAFQKFMNDEGVISLKDSFVESINRIYEEYKLYMDKILDFRKDHPKLRFIYEDRFNACIKTAGELERQCKDLASRYRNLFR